MSVSALADGVTPGGVETVEPTRPNVSAGLGTWARILLQVRLSSVRPARNVRGERPPDQVRSERTWNVFSSFVTLLLDLFVNLFVGD